MILRMNLVSLLMLFSIISRGCKSAAVSQQERRARSPSSACDVLNTSESTEWAKGKTTLKKTVTYLISFENLDQLKPSECFTPEYIEYEGRIRCAVIRESTKQPGIVEFSIVNQSKSWENARIVLQGKCEESSESTFQSGKYQHSMDFKPEGGWTLVKPLQ